MAGRDAGGIAPASRPGLDELLGRHGVPVSGGTSLFRYIDFERAGSLFFALGERGILLRHFADRPNVLAHRICPALRKNGNGWDLRWLRG